MNLFCRVPCRTKLFLIAGLLGLSTSLAGLAQILPLSKHQIIAFWSVAIVGGCIALGALAFTAYGMMQTLDKLARRACAIAGGDLTGSPFPVVVNDELGNLSRSINVMQEKLQSMVAAIADESAGLRRDATELSRVGEQAFSRTSEQSAQTHQAASAMQEMSISIAEVSHHAQTAADQGREAASVAREGGTIVDDMLSGMNTISESVSQSAETVRRLGQDSEQIIRIVNVIEEIAEKTNLLALNAAIEAARAGEQGRGFAVVAGEVRRLAESTRSATSEIAQMVQTITQNTQAAVQAMAAGTERVGHGMEITARAGNSLKRIIAATDQVESMIAQIATASTQQSVAAQEFSQNLEVINRLGEDQSAATTATRALVDSVRDGAGRLEESVGHFRIGDKRSAVSVQSSESAGDRCSAFRVLKSTSAIA
jgi:methyl-accepting chemotaxis protein